MGSPRDWMQTVKQTVDRIKAIIGNPDDTGGSTTAGTVMAKENAILQKQEEIAKKQGITNLGGAWFEYCTVSNSVSVDSGDTKMLEVTMPEDGYFLGFNSYQGWHNGSSTVEFTIRGITYQMQASYSKEAEREMRYYIGGFANWQTLRDDSRGHTGIFPLLSKGEKVSCKIYNSATSVINAIEEIRYLRVVE